MFVHLFLNTPNGCYKKQFRNNLKLKLSFSIVKNWGGGWIFLFFDGVVGVQIPKKYTTLPVDIFPEKFSLTSSAVTEILSFRQTDIKLLCIIDNYTIFSESQEYGEDSQIDETEGSNAAPAPQVPEKIFEILSNFVEKQMRESWLIKFCMSPLGSH